MKIEGTAPSALGPMAPMWEATARSLQKPMPKFA